MIYFSFSTAPSSDTQQDIKGRTFGNTFIAKCWSACRLRYSFDHSIVRRKFKRSEVLTDLEVLSMQQNPKLANS